MRRWIGATAVAILLVVGGCSEPPPGPIGPIPKPSPEPVSVVPTMSPAQAYDRYQALLDEIHLALETEYPDIQWRTLRADPELTLQPDGRCILLLEPFTSSASIAAIGEGYEALRPALDPILESYGFTPLSQTQSINADVFVISIDTEGAEFSLNSDGGGYTHYRLDVPVDSATCDEAELATP